MNDPVTDCSDLFGIDATQPRVTKQVRNMIDRILDAIKRDSPAKVLSIDFSEMNGRPRFEAGNTPTFALEMFKAIYFC
jgi:hypothetical protein